MEVCTMKEEVLNPKSSVKANEMEEDGIYYLSGKPFFDVVLAKSQVPPRCQLHLPTSMTQMLPRVTAPVVLRHGGKIWNLSYIGDSGIPRFDLRWRAFVTENHLKLGDACVFELMENSSTNVRFKVHILRNYWPPELLVEIDSRGKAPDKPIDID